MGYLGRLMFLFVVTAMCISTPETVAAQTPDYRPGELLIKFKVNRETSAMERYRQSRLIQDSRSLGANGVHQINLPHGLGIDQAMRLYQADPEVEVVEPNYLLRAQDIPDDPHFDLQWGLSNTGQRINGYEGTPGADIDLPNARSIGMGSPEVVVAVVDTGCAWRHPDITQNIRVNPGEIGNNGIDDDHNGLVDDVHGWDFVDKDNDPEDTGGHGTHVSGIIAARSDNAVGISGVAGVVSILPLRFMNAFEVGTTADAIAAIHYALSQGATIINCSWGGNGYSNLLKQTMAAADALFVCAAGNETADTDKTPFYPAAFELPNVVSVAASDQMDQLAWFSNFGDHSVDVAAPGMRIYSLQNSRRILWQDDFSDPDLPGWQAGGDSPDWSVANPPNVLGNGALAVTSESNYAPLMNTWIMTSPMDLRDAAAVTVDFYLMGSTEVNADYLYLEVSTDGSRWYSQPLRKGSTIVNYGLSGEIPNWVPVMADLGPWDGNETVYLRFRFRSDNDTQQDGYFIDNLTIRAAGAEPAYQFMNGTSMAAAFVSGVAALVQSVNPIMSTVELKTVVEKCIDLDYSFFGEVASCGRINVYNALTLLSDVPLSARFNESDQITLDWSAAPPLASQVVIERREEGQPAFKALASIDPTVTTYIDTDVSIDRPYYYRVHAQTLDGRSGYSPQALANDTTSPFSAGVGGDGSGAGGGGGCFINVLQDE